MEKAHFHIEENALKVGSIKLEDLAAQYNTPLYIYSEGILQERLELLQDAFKEFDIFYSFKANPNPHICRFIKMKGHFADVASVGELRLAVESGFQQDEIIYSAPGKKEAEIDYALDKCMIIADSLQELKLINEISRNKGKITPVGIRINPEYSIQSSDALEVMSGFPSKFGIDEEALKPSMGLIGKLCNIKIIGIQIYMGSQIVEHDTIYNNFLNIFKVALFCKEELGMDLQFIDFGGGFGIQHMPEDPGLDIYKAGSRVALLKECPEFKELFKLRLIIESGRFISGPGGLYLARVLDIKSSRGKKYAIIEGGMNTFFRPVFIKENRYPIVIANKGDHPPAEKISLGGVMCTPIDIMEEDVWLPHLEKGDLVAFLNAGAYGYTMSLVNFISHSHAQELYVTTDMKVLQNKEDIG